MFRVLDADSPISKEDFLQFEEILGKKLPKTMLDFYLKNNGGQPQVRGVHDEHHLFPFNSFDSLDEMKKSLSLRKEDYGKVYFYVLEEKADLYGQWPSFEDFLNSFVEE